MALSRQWADKPLMLIPTPRYRTQRDDMWIEGSSHMCNVHNALFRGFNSIYQQAPHIQVDDKAAFLGYCQTWVKFLKSHTEHEESGLFVKAEELLQEKLFDNMIHAHENMLKPLHKVDAYLTNLDDPKTFSSLELISLLDELKGPFESHFNEEIDVLAGLSNHPNNPEPGSEAERKTIAAFDKWGQDSLIQPGITDVLVFFLLNVDRDYEDGLWKHWPPIPVPVRWAMTNVAGLWHNSWWKFASCNASGRRKELYALQ